MLQQGNASKCGGEMVNYAAKKYISIKIGERWFYSRLPAPGLNLERLKSDAYHTKDTAPKIHKRYTDIYRAVDGN